jgi:hypothetical protein
MPLNRSLMWPLGLLGATIVGAFAYYAYMGWALGHDMCGAKIEERLVSPDSAYEAVVYEFNCGCHDLVYRCGWNSTTWSRSLEDNVCVSR